VIAEGLSMAATVEVKASAGTHGRLLAWLDAGVDTQGERYAEIRRRLIGYFDRWNRPAPEALADETFRRISGLLALGLALDDELPARHCYGVARAVLLEDQARHGTSMPRERRIDHVECRLAELPAVERNLVLEYYRDLRRAGADNRRLMAGRMNLTSRALGLRAARVRDMLFCRTLSRAK